MAKLTIGPTALAAANTFTAAQVMKGFFNFSVYGTFVGTITLQRSFDNGGLWQDVSTHTTPVEKFVQEPEEGVQYRAGFKTGQFTSGTANVRISREV